MNTLVLAASAAALGYAAGRLRPCSHLLNWAQDQTDIRSPLSPVFWAAVLVLLLAVATVWTLHPRRSAANRRSWRDDPQATAPRYNPDWAAPPSPGDR